MDGCQGAWRKNQDLGGLPYDNDQLFVGVFSSALSLHSCKAMVVGYVFSSIDQPFTIDHKHFLKFRHIFSQYFFDKQLIIFDQHFNI